eukprot:452237-Rhodomonas_salina.1
MQRSGSKDLAGRARSGRCCRGWSSWGRCLSEPPAEALRLPPPPCRTQGKAWSESATWHMSDIL